ncbi:gliding motility lipoprotein GldJ [Flavicella sediminum]|uniref:gliding motility lipoprotein GldJ n=1 Tax=Flavicella sediminum TaxID=2585141 RepID=UPI00112169A8|nr:gliding motility lipoprotein GldJ [Flavicella sediminum]
MINYFKFFVLILTISVFTSCEQLSKLSNSGNSGNTSTLTGWKFNDAEYGGFGINKNYKGQKAPYGMVLIEGGTFTMGSVQDDIMADWNTTPTRMQVRSFYMDEAEVSNSEYLFYLQWLERVFPPRNEDYTNIYESAIPDTLVWRNALGSNESLSETYLRHPAYANYPVVGVSWIQANDYCEWRTDRVNQKMLMDLGVLKGRDEIDEIGKDHFSTETYYANPKLLFSGDSTVYGKGLPSFKRADLKKDSIEDTKVFKGRHVKPHDGILYPDFRLPTEAEWEYAAKALIENREYNSLRGRKKYPWNGRYTRSKSAATKGDQLANFKQGKGDYSGLAGWTNDGADITNEIKSYPPNAFGLYDMAGNVAEWVYDVYRPIIDTKMNDFNYVRGNIFYKKLIDEDGKVSIANYSDVVYDTLPNGKLIPRDIPGRIMYVPITEKDVQLRTNYNKSDNSSVNDGDLINSRYYNKDIRDLAVKPRMYNSPLSPKSTFDYDAGDFVTKYDDKPRTTLIGDRTRVYKGGSWRDREFWLDPAQRKYLPEYMSTDFIGFRCALDKVGNMNNGKKTPFNK